MKPVLFHDNSPRREQRVVERIGTATGQLLEREAIIDRLCSAVERTGSGEGCVVVVEGEAGIGKTALLRVAHESALSAGFTVITARGGRLERDFAHGVVRQLYEPLLHGTPPGRRKALLNGAAELAAPVLGLRTAPVRSDDRLPGDPAFAVNHGLYWLTANVADSSCLLLVVDDAHWVDDASLLFLTYLGRRLEGLSVLVLLGLRGGEPGAPRELIESLFELPRAESLRPLPLSEQAAGLLIQRLLGGPADDGFRRACHELTGGNPFLLEELLRALHAEGIEPREQSAGRIRRLAPQSISRSVLGRLGAMGPEALALAKAVAVLDTDAALRHVAALAGMDSRAAEAAADALTGAYILAPGRPLRFMHPIMRQAVYEDVSEARRAAEHGRAARLLDSEDPDRAAVHLLPAEPAGDGWVVERLRAAARRALARGAPDAAAALLRRALDEPPPRGERAAALLELGRAERLAGDTSAVEHLRRALEEVTDPLLRAEAARELATALAMAARLDEAVELLEDAIEKVPDREVALLLEAHLLGLSQASDELAARVAPRLERMCEGIHGDTPGERLALAASVFHQTFLGLGSGNEVAATARRAWGAGRLLREVTGDHFAFYGPLIALRDSDEHEDLRPMFEQAIADARGRGSAAAVALTLATFARLEQLQGNLVSAEAAARSALEAAVSSTHYHLVLPLALSSLILPLTERGEVAAAEDVLNAHGMAAGRPPSTTTANPLLAARAKLRLAQDRVEDAVADTEVWLQRQRLRGGLNPVGASSILNPALPFLAAGRRQDARALAEEMLAVAERWGVPGYTGTCTAVLGLVIGGERGVEKLHRGVVLLEQSPRRLDLAHALVDLGAALRRANRRADAREPLSRGMELAHRCSAAPLAERARRELQATGARPRRLVLTGVDSLTAQERRVAEMAADGLSNPEIAQALFVTRRTVETHLRHAYQKLSIATRDQLTQALERGRNDVGARIT